MSSKHKKYRPYIRRLKPSDKADDFRTAVRLALYRQVGWSGWVMAQYGFPGVVIAVDRNRRDLMRSPLAVWVGDKTFKQWARGVQLYATTHRANGEATTNA